MSMSASLTTAAAIKSASIPRVLSSVHARKDSTSIPSKTGTAIRITVLTFVPVGLLKISVKFLTVSRNDKQCLDEDECAVNNGGCNQVCLNRPGNFSCECRHGYVLASDGFSCLEIVPIVTAYCPALEPPPGGYLHCSSRPGVDGYKPGTTCSLRCRKGYTFRRHKPHLTWQANNVPDSPPEDNSPASLTVLAGARQSAGGLAMLQGWKATQVRDWNYNEPSDEAHKKYKGNCSASARLQTLKSALFRAQWTRRARETRTRRGTWT